MTRLSLELGGNAPVLVFPDVDLDQVVAGATAAQVPQRRPGVRVAAALPRRARRGAGVRRRRSPSRSATLRVGPGLDAATQVGPLINARQRDRVEALVAAATGRRRARRASAAPGRRIATRATSTSRRWSPTSPREAPLYRDEIFGPVLPVTHVRRRRRGDRAAPTRRATGSPPTCWTNHLPTAMHAAERLEFGMVGVNEWTPHGAEAPFAGRKDSGLGHASRAPRASTTTWRPSWSRSAVCRDERARASAGRTDARPLGPRPPQDRRHRQPEQRAGSGGLRLVLGRRCGWRRSSCSSCPKPSRC